MARLPLGSRLDDKPGIRPHRSRRVFWRDVASLRAHLVPEAAEIELRTQVERAVEAGIAVTHIDAHMAAAMLPELLEVHIRLARDFGVVPILPRSITWCPDPDAYRAAIDALDRERLPVVDHCRGTLAIEQHELAAGWNEVITELPAGLTHLALHCTQPGDFSSMAPDHAAWRIQEYRYLASGGLAALCARAAVGVSSTRELQTAWLERMSARQVDPRPQDGWP
jgi:predicted glycoside hydrolase/deacetylase ChbG (UPF0249 family)